MRPLSESTGRVAGKTFNRKYVALGRILTHWEDIIGAKMAGKAQPVKLRYIKHEKSKKPTATLDIATTTADATLLHYQKDLILERINQIFGDQWVSAIRFVSMPSNKAPSAPKKPKRPLTGAEKNHLSGVLGNIEDEDMHRVLENLGKAVMLEEKDV